MIDPLLENTKPRPSRAAQAKMVLETVPESGFNSWLKSQIRSYRIGLTAGYVVLTVYAIVAFKSGVPTFKLTAVETWSPGWAVGLFICALLGFVGSFRSVKAFEIVELVGAWGSFLATGCLAASALVLAYVYGDTDREAYAYLVLYPFTATAIRMLFLQMTARANDK